MKTCTYQLYFPLRLVSLLLRKDSVFPTEILAVPAYNPLKPMSRLLVRARETVGRATA